jgi:hypothetical protein
MNHEEKIDYMRIAAGICNYGFTNTQLDMMVTIYEYVLKEKGKGNLAGIASLQVEVKKRADIKKRQELLDKVSEKTD